ncbi:MAG: pyruvate synthase subunit beta [Candidatus Portnoybacteria bacterium]|nr:pyruvate synthase subunit beta [Candidatus Portnoybacteria bacterium]
MDEIRKNPKKKCLLAAGHTACAGCGLALILKYIIETLGKNSVLVVPACCLTVVSGNNLRTCVPIPLLHTPFETAAVTAEGVKIGFEIDGKEITVVALAGDGGTFDIGLQALSGAAERGADIIYICYDNEAYMNTGIQRSGATPRGAITATTPGGCLTWKKNMPEIVAAHRVPYVAVASIAWPDDFKKKILMAKKMKGFKYIQVFSPCQAGQKFPSDLTIEAAELAVKTGVYPVFEIIEGKIIGETMRPKPDAILEPIEKYLNLQGRFRHLKEADIKAIQKRVIEERIAFLKRAGLEPPASNA